MCGIFGYVTARPSARFAPVLMQGLFVDSLRGSCGTGIYAADLKDEKAFTYKRALIGPDFLNSQQFAQFRARQDRSQVVIGHNRASTIGDARDEHCHPFHFGHIGFVHNGTLRDYRGLVKDNRFSHGVDSAYAAYSLYENADPLATLEKVQGPYVFVWHDMEKQTFNIARNNNRDICYVLDKDQETLFFASEFGMLSWLLERNSVDIGNNKFRNPKEHTLISWDLTKPFTKAPKIVPYKEYVPPPFVSNNFGGGRVSYMDRLMQELELKQDEMLMFEMEGWESYDDYRKDDAARRGFIHGKVLAPGRKVDGAYMKLHAILSEEATKWLEAKYGKGKFSTVLQQWEKSKSTDIISIKEPVALLKDGKTMTKEQAAEFASSLLPALPAPAKADDALEVEVLYQGPDNTFLDEEEFLELVKCGCMYCGESINTQDSEEIIWCEWTAGSDPDPLCKRCQDSIPAVREMRSWGVVFPRDFVGARSAAAVNRRKDN
jgi:predicted glutamine amidotransferase